MNKKISLKVDIVKVAKGSEPIPPKRIIAPKKGKGVKKPKYKANYFAWDSLLNFGV